MALRTEELTFSLGPQHPSTHGVFRAMVTIDGERVVHVDPVIGYLHRGTEKIAEWKTYPQIIPYTDRMDYLSAMLNNYCHVGAVEKLLGLEIPEHAEYIRIIVMELNRIASHLVWWGTFLLDLGAMSPFLYAFKDRQVILDLLEEISGARLTYSYMRIGGVKRDATQEWLRRVDDFMDEMVKNIHGYNNLVTGNEIFQSRVKQVGVYDEAFAKRWGLSGACLRCTGNSYDVRKSDPYSLYPKFDFEIPTRTSGDVWARYIIRIEEMLQSIRIVKQAIRNLPDGPFMGKAPRNIRPPKGEVYFHMESPRGDMGCYIVSDGSDHPYRWHWRAPEFANLAAFPAITEGANIADMIAILGAIDIVLGGVDR